MFCATAAELPLDKYVLCNGCSATFRQICSVQRLQCYLQINMFCATTAVLPLDKFFFPKLFCQRHTNNVDACQKQFVKYVLQQNCQCFQVDVFCEFFVIISPIRKYNVTFLRHISILYYESINACAVIYIHVYLHSTAYVCQT